MTTSITLTTSFRTIPHLPIETWLKEFTDRGSPVPSADVADCHAACSGWAVALDQAIGETSLKDADAIRDKNLLRLMESDGSRFKVFANYGQAFGEYMRRMFDPAYKGGVYYPGHLGVEGIVPGYDLSLAGYKVIYQGGPKCLDTRGKTCANGETYNPLLPMLGLSAVNNPALPSINRSIAASMIRYDRWFGGSASTPTTPQPPTGPTEPSPGQPGGTTLTFGRVPKPVWTDRQIPDANNWAWDNLGQRKALGVTYHRQVGWNWGTDGWFRGGGGGAGLTDFGIDCKTGETLEWNSYLGKGRPGISPNRAGHASGPWENPPGDGRAFVAKYGVNAINRDLVSLEIDGMYDTPIQAAGLKQIIHMTAYLADQQKIRWDTFPLNPNTGLVFTYEHGEFQAHKPCAGGVVRGHIPNIISGAADTMKRYQTGV
jgi:hypothetical protein